MEDLNHWATVAASWITLIGAGVKLIRDWLPKIRESLKQWKATRKR